MSKDVLHAGRKPLDRRVWIFPTERRKPDSFLRRNQDGHRRYFPVAFQNKGTDKTWPQMEHVTSPRFLRVRCSTQSRNRNVLFWRASGSLRSFCHTRLILSAWRHPHRHGRAIRLLLQNQVSLTHYPDHSPWTHRFMGCFVNTLSSFCETVLVVERSLFSDFRSTGYFILFWW